MPARWLTLDELAAFVATPDAIEDLATATGTPAVVVDVTAGPPLRALANLACVTIAVGAGPATDAFDVAVPTETQAQEVVAAVEQMPIAATALAVLLRGSETRSTAEGLAAESAVYSTLQAGPEFARWRASRPPRHHPPSSTPPVLVDRDGDVVHVTLNRPERHNAYSVDVRDALVEALAWVAADPTVERVILTGAGPSFCSGGDLDEFGSRPDPAQAHLVRLTRSAARLADALADRLVVHLHGACLGAGIELPAFAHRVVASPDAKIGLPELSLGLIPGAGGTVSLPRRIGRQRTAWLAMTGAHLDAEQARTWGLLEEVDTQRAR